MASTLDVTVMELIEASPDRVRRLMFDPRKDPTWMAAVKSVEAPTDDIRLAASQTGGQNANLIASIQFACFPASWFCYDWPP